MSLLLEALRTAERAKQKKLQEAEAFSVPVVPAVLPSPVSPQSEGTVSASSLPLEEIPAPALTLSLVDDLPNPVPSLPLSSVEDLPSPASALSLSLADDLPAPPVADFVLANWSGEMAEFVQPSPAEPSTASFSASPFQPEGEGLTLAEPFATFELSLVPLEDGPFSLSAQEKSPGQLPGSAPLDEQGGESLDEDSLFILPDGASSFPAFSLDEAAGADGPAVGGEVEKDSLFTPEQDASLLLVALDEGKEEKKENFFAPDVGGLAVFQLSADESAPQQKDWLNGPVEASPQRAPVQEETPLPVTGLSPGKAERMPIQGNGGDDLPRTELSSSPSVSRPSSPPLTLAAEGELLSAPPRVETVVVGSSPGQGKAEAVLASPSDPFARRAALAAIQGNRQEKNKRLLWGAMAVLLLILSGGGFYLYQTLALLEQSTARPQPVMVPPPSPPPAPLMAAVAPVGQGSEPAPLSQGNAVQPANLPEPGPKSVPSGDGVSSPRPVVPPAVAQEPSPAGAAVVAPLVAGTTPVATIKPVKESLAVPPGERAVPSSVEKSGRNATPVKSGRERVERVAPEGVAKKETPRQKERPAPATPGVTEPPVRAALSPPAAGNKRGPEKSASRQIGRSNAAESRHLRSQQAYSAFQAGDTAQAELLYRDLLEESPGDPGALLGMASVSVKNGDLATAQTLYRRVLDQDPGNSVARANLIALAGEGDAIQGISQLRQLLAKDPEASHLHFALGSLLASQGQWSQAQEAFFRAYRLDNTNPDVAYNLAVSLDQLNQAKVALPYYRQALLMGMRTPVGFDPSGVERRIREISDALPSPPAGASP